MTQHNEINDIRRNLGKPLHPALVRHRTTGRNESYLPTHTAITQANRIFGALAWSVEIVNHKPVLVNGECIGYQCHVRIHIPQFGFSGDGMGFNALTTNQGNILQTPDSHDTAIKGAESDAVKRALRYAGEQFANHLYETPEERNEMAEAAIPIVARRMQIERAEAARIVMRPHASLGEVPLNTSINHYYGLDPRTAKPRPETAEATREQGASTEPNHEPNHHDEPAAHRQDPDPEPNRQPDQQAANDHPVNNFPDDPNDPFTPR